MAAKRFARIARNDTQGAIMTETSDTTTTRQTRSSEADWLRPKLPQTFLRRLTGRIVVEQINRMAKRLADRAKSATEPRSV